MYRLNTLGIRIQAGSHLIKSGAQSLVEQASQLIADAEQEAAAIRAAAEAAYEAEKLRGYEEGCERAVSEAVERMVAEQGDLDRGLAEIEEELAQLVSNCVRKLIGGKGETELALGYIRIALRRMRHEKRIRLAISSEQYPLVREAVSSLAEDVPQAELIDVVENSTLKGLHFIMESSIGRIEGSIDRNLAEIHDRLMERARRHAAARHTSSEEGDESDESDDEEVETVEDGARAMGSEDEDADEGEDEDEDAGESGGEEDDGRS